MHNFNFDRLTLQIGEGRAYYNLGNVFHSKAKQLARGTRLEPGDYPVEVRVLLHKAVECYEWVRFRLNMMHENRN